MQKAAKEFDVALLRVDGESFAIFGARSIVMRNCIVMGFKHAQVDQKRADHHACATLASLAMNDDHRLHSNRSWWAKILLFWILRELVILFHPLQEQGSIHAKDVHFLQIGHIVVQKREFADREVSHRVSCILILQLGAQVINFDHRAMVFVKKGQNVGFSVPVETLEAWGWETASYYTISNVGQVKIVAALLKSVFICRDNGSYPVARTAWPTSLLLTAPISRSNASTLIVWVHLVVGCLDTLRTFHHLAISIGLLLIFRPLVLWFVIIFEIIDLLLVGDSILGRMVDQF